MSGKKIFHDITLDFSPDLVVYPGDPALEITEHMKIENGDIANISILRFGSHTGTHIDAPRHFIASGTTVDRLPLEHFIGKAKVFEFKNEEKIEADSLKGLEIARGDIILIKTKNSHVITNKEFKTDYTYIAPDAAEYLADIGIKTLGFDYLSVEKYGSGDFRAHHALLEKGIVIIEGLVLRGIKPGEYEIIALPLKIRNGNGSPVRAILIEG